MSNGASGYGALLQARYAIMEWGHRFQYDICSATDENYSEKSHYSTIYKKCHNHHVILGGIYTAVRQRLYVWAGKSLSKSTNMNLNVRWWWKPPKGSVLLTIKRAWSRLIKCQHLEKDCTVCVGVYELMLIEVLNASSESWVLVLGLLVWLWDLVDERAL